MDEEFWGIFKNLGRIFLESGYIASGFLLIILSYSVFGRPSFANIGAKALIGLNFITGNILRFIIFILICHFIGFAIPMVLKEVPISKTRRLFDVRGIKMPSDQYFKVLQFLQEKGNEQILKLIDEVYFNHRKARTIGSALFVSALILLLGFIFSLNWVLFVLSLLSGIGVKLIDIFIKKTTEHGDSLFRELAVFVSEER
jgi:hypothetical protein